MSPGLDLKEKNEPRRADRNFTDIIDESIFGIDPVDVAPGTDLKFFLGLPGVTCRIDS